MMNKKDIICINCGYHGHTSKNCNYPITSFGVILYKIINNEIKYLMVQRKDSLCYTEFMRGKYDLKNISYIKKLFTYMTDYEKNNILNIDFDVLWKKLWIHNSDKMKKEYTGSKMNFMRLKKGYKLKTNDNILDINLEYFIDKTPYLHETEWEFPKGRRKLNESDISCALREFEEETGISKKLVMIDDVNKQYEEIFIGKNRMRYRNIFYLGQYTKNNLEDIFFDINNIDQVKEIKDVKWFNINIIHEKIMNNMDKLELFNRVHNQIRKSNNKI